MKKFLPLLLIGGAGYLIYKAFFAPKISVGPGLSPGSSFSVNAPTQRLAMAEGQYQAMLRSGIAAGNAAALVQAQIPEWSPGM